MGRQINLKSSGEVQKMLEANQIVAATLAMLTEKIRPGLTTLQLDKWAEGFARQQGAVPAFKGYRGFPGSLCVSINEEVVHGIPSERVILQDGDIIFLFMSSDLANDFHAFGYCLQYFIIQIVDLCFQ